MCAKSMSSKIAALRGAAGRSFATDREIETYADGLGLAMSGTFGGHSPDFEHTLTDLADALKAAFDTYSGAGSDWHVYSRVDRQLRQVINFDIGDLFDTQRGRQDRVPEVRTARTLNA